MKVKELIEELNKLNPELEMILSTDSGFSIVDEIESNCFYIADKNYKMKNLMFCNEWTKKDAGISNQAFEKLQKTHCCILWGWPLN